MRCQAEPSSKAPQTAQNLFLKQKSKKKKPTQNEIDLTNIFIVPAQNSFSFLFPTMFLTISCFSIIYIFVLFCYFMPWKFEFHY